MSVLNKNTLASFLDFRITLAPESMKFALEELNEQLLASLTRKTLQAGDTLFRQGDVGNSMYIVREGRLEARVRQANGTEMKVGEIAAGDPVGEIQLLTGGRRTATVLAIADTVLLEFPSDRITEISLKFPNSYQQLKQKILQRLRRNQLMQLMPNLMDDFDEYQLQDLEAQLEWLRVKKGDLLIRQGDPGDAMYIVVSGRLRVVHENPDGSQEPLLEIARGETVGEMSFFTNDIRSASVYAMRDSVLVKLSSVVFYELIGRHPSFHNHITRGIVRRLQTKARSVKSQVGVTNFAIVPLDNHPIVYSFIRAFVRSMGQHGSTLYLNHDQLSASMGFHEDADNSDPSNGLRISTWLDEQERRYKYVFLETTPTINSWSRRAIQRADHIIFIAKGTSETFVQDIEKQILKEAGHTRKTLALLYNDGSSPPVTTRYWLANREIDQHFNIRIDTSKDIDRFARALAGRSIGLVLSGGGARGFGHMGVIKALQESNIPIDMVGGTSMGAVIAAHVAMNRKYDEMYARTKEAFVEAKPFKKQIPLFSFYKGKKLDEVTYQILYQDNYIEDTWLPCYFVSSSLTSSDIAVHDSGLIWNAIRASTALPGIITPVLLNDQLHVDGGLLNNLPVDVMRERSQGKVIAVDVTQMKSVPPQATKAPNLLDFVMNRGGSSNKNTDFPSILEVLMRSMLLGSVKKTRLSLKEADFSICPPVDDYGLLEFPSIDPIVEAAYQHTKGKLAMGVLQEKLGL